METSTKVLLAGLAALAGISFYAKKARGTYNPLSLVGPQTSGPALPSSTPTQPKALPPAATSAPPFGGSASNSPEVQAALNQLLAASSRSPNSPEIQAAINVLQSAPPNSPEAMTALTLLDGLPQSPEAQAALSVLTAQQSQSPASRPFVASNDPVRQAALDAEAVKMATINALNTPQGDRTPEQLALLSALGSLPVFAQ